MYKILLCSLTLTVCITQVCARSVHEPSNVCDIFENPRKFDGKSVRLDGVIFTDFFEYSGIRYPSCPERLLRFRGARPPLNNNKLEKTLNDARLTPSRKVYATVRGIVRYYPGQVPALVIFVSTFSHIRTSDGYERHRH